MSLITRVGATTEAALKSEAKMFFCASHDFRSEDPSERLPAVATLIALARSAIPPIRSRAAAMLVKEFGPYAVTHGLSGCAAPISEVETCSVQTRDCRGCPWFWLPQEDEALPEAIEGIEAGASSRSKTSLVH